MKVFGAVFATLFLLGLAFFLYYIKDLPRPEKFTEGVIPQTTVAVERVAPMGDPIWIRLKGYQLSLRKSEAANVYVEVV